MHVHEFAYARACEHVCHRMRVYICASTCVCVYLRGCARRNVCVASLCEHMCLCVCVHVYMRAGVRASVRACVRAHVCS